MKRREVITLLGGVAVAQSLFVPRVVRAQQPTGGGRRVGILMGTAENDLEQRGLVSAFVQALADLGWHDGRNIRIEYRWASGDTDRLRAEAASLAAVAPDVIFCQGTPAATALHQAAPATPIVFVMVTDPIGTSLVTSLARPGGNITGFTNYEYSMGGKWLETLKEVAPNLTTVAVIMNPENPALIGALHAIETAAPTLGLQATSAPIHDPADIERAIDAFSARANSGLLVLGDFITLTHRAFIVELAARHRIPAIYNLRAFATIGGLMSYGIDPSDLFRRAATYVDRIFKGAKPADLPIQQPTKFELVINLKTAKALGLTIPQTLLVAADEVIE
jgi:putative tryptophan/tyrosine transport system substrate-binding protein